MTCICITLLNFNFIFYEKNFVCIFFFLFLLFKVAFDFFVTFIWQNMIIKNVRIVCVYVCNNKSMFWYIFSCLQNKTKHKKKMDLLEYFFIFYMMFLFHFLNDFKIFSFFMVFTWQHSGASNVIVHAKTWFHFMITKVMFPYIQLSMVAILKLLNYVWNMEQKSQNNNSIYQRPYIWHVHRWVIS